MGGMELHIPDGVFSMSDLEKANAHLGPIAVRTRFVRAIAEGRVEVVQSSDGADRSFMYRKCDEER